MNGFIFLFFMFFFVTIFARLIYEYYYQDFFIFFILSSNLGLTNFYLLSSFVSVYIFCIIFSLLLSSFLPYIVLVDFFYMLQIISFLGLTFWWISFFYFLSSERFSLFLCKSGDGFLNSYFLFFIEVVSTVIQPFSLIVRLFVNFMVGFFLLNLSYLLFESWTNTFLFFGLLPVLFELGVFLIQSFIFTYLLVSYFIES